MQGEYVGGATAASKLIRTWVFGVLTSYAKRFDFQAAQRVTMFVANSRFVAERIKNCYGRIAEVVYPPVGVGKFVADRPLGEYYLIVSQLVPYKRIDLAVAACTKGKKKLIIVGEGSERSRLERIAGTSVRFLGWQKDEVVKELMENCRAFLFPQIEDFGITAVEAQAAGRAVIAFRGGGAMESVVEGETGLFFDSQDEIALLACINNFEALLRRRGWDNLRCRENAEKFSEDNFQTQFTRVLSNCSFKIL
jgi:glycosyltransferase involved in cell wall biosynthesis